jgi:hypothetical protein
VRACVLAVRCGSGSVQADEGRAVVIDVGGAEAFNALGDVAADCLEYGVDVHQDRLSELDRRPVGLYPDSLGCVPAAVRRSDDRPGDGGIHRLAEAALACRQRCWLRRFACRDTDLPSAGIARRVGPRIAWHSQPLTLAAWGLVPCFGRRLHVNITQKWKVLPGGLPDVLLGSATLRSCLVPRASCLDLAPGPQASTWLSPWDRARSPQLWASMIAACRSRSGAVRSAGPRPKPHSVPTPKRSRTVDAAATRRSAPSMPSSW